MNRTTLRNILAGTLALAAVAAGGINNSTLSPDAWKAPGAVATSFGSVALRRDGDAADDRPTPMLYKEPVALRREGVQDMGGGSTHPDSSL